MFGRIFRNIFAAGSQDELSVAKFNHCSSICKHKGGVLVAWYAGSGECNDDQSVYITYKDDKTQSDPIRLGDKTGNPVLWSDNKGPILLWSYFEDEKAGIKLKTPVDRWKCCSLWIQRIKFDDGIQFVGEPTQIVEPGQHLLGRCSPIKTNGTMLLPLYNEVYRCGVIYQIENMQASMVGTIGKDMIQPTIWEDDDGLLLSLSRNFTKHREFHAKFSHSDDNGTTWSKPRRTLILNNNSSLCTIKWNKLHLILWNDTQSLVRRNLTLGIISIEDMAIIHEIVPSVIKILQISDYGAYPTMCIDKDNRLHMTFTTRSKKIAHHVWNWRHFIEKCDEREHIRRIPGPHRGRDSS